MSRKVFDLYSKLSLSAELNSTREQPPSLPCLKSQPRKISEQESEKTRRAKMPIAVPT